MYIICCGGRCYPNTNRIFVNLYFVQHAESESESERECVCEKKRSVVVNDEQNEILLYNTASLFSHSIRCTVSTRLIHRQTNIRTDKQSNIWTVEQSNSRTDRKRSHFMPGMMHQPWVMRHLARDMFPLTQPCQKHLWQLQHKIQGPFLWMFCLLLDET